MLMHDPQLNPSGTFRIGFFTATYVELVDAFGKPTTYGAPMSYFNGGDKVSVEWVLDTKYGVITIYDYKGDWDGAKALINDWHIGGGVRARDNFNNITADLIEAIYSSTDWSV